VVAASRSRGREAAEAQRVRRGVTYTRRRRRPKEVIWPTPCDVPPGGARRTPVRQLLPSGSSRIGAPEGSVPYVWYGSMSSTTPRCRGDRSQPAGCSASNIGWDVLGVAAGLSVRRRRTSRGGLRRLWSPRRTVSTNRLLMGPCPLRIAVTVLRRRCPPTETTRCCCRVSQVGHQEGHSGHVGAVARAP